MTAQIDSDAVINGVRFTQEGSHPASPAAGYSILYNFTGTFPGLYLQDAAGNKVGPFITGSASAGGRTLIAEFAPSGTSSVSFTSIPDTYTSLEIDFIVRSVVASNNESLRIAFNGDSTASNYRFIQYGASAAGTTNNTGGDDNVIAKISGASSPSGSCGAGKIFIPFYAKTVFNKQATSSLAYRYDASSSQEVGNNFGVEWENTSAITQIDISLPSNFENGTIIRLYGVL